MFRSRKQSKSVEPFLFAAGVFTLGWAGTMDPAPTLTKIASSTAEAISSHQQVEQPGAPLLEPTQVMSNRGVLELTLEAAPSPITVGGQTFMSNVYNGQYIPPVFRLRRGEELQLRLVNKIGPADVQIDGTQATNLHYHGMSISPRPPADDIYITIPSLQMLESGPLQTGHGGAHAMRDNYVYEYRWRVPDDHEQGSFWYHSHAHGDAEPQVLSGLSGLFVIDGLIEDYYPWLAGAQERLMLLKDIELPGANDGDPKTKTINGQANPTIAMKAHTPQIWRLGNVGADAFFNLELEGHEFWVLEQDGNVLDRPVRQSHLAIAPGARYTVFVDAPSTGTYRLRSRAFDTGPQGDPNPDVVLATVNVAHRSVGQGRARHDETPGVPLPTVRRQPSPVEQLRSRPLTGRRTITFSETADGNTFFINGEQWDPDRIDTSVQLGDVEEWTILNTSGEVHVFHIHQLDFLVTEINGQRYEARSLLDTITVPYQQGSVPGSVKIIVPFLRDRMVGKFVYHCHILEHEDGGMMANIEVRGR